MCLATFNELCKNNLGAADYIALAHTFHTVALQGVPIFTSAAKSEAYRFVTLVDVLYENRIQVMCSAEGSPFEIFRNIFSQEDAKKQVCFLPYLLNLLMSHCNLEEVMQVLNALNALPPHWSQAYHYQASQVPRHHCHADGPFDDLVMVSIVLATTKHERVRSLFMFNFGQVWTLRSDRPSTIGALPSVFALTKSFFQKKTVFQKKAVYWLQESSNRD